MFKSQNLAKSGKKLSKSRNSTNFGAIETGPKFLIFDAKTTFNPLLLAFTKARILWHFNSKYHIKIETNTLGYIIGKILTQLTSKTNFDGIITQNDLTQWHSVVFFSKKMIYTKT